ncbi:hypothetical protein [Candidatus Chloroploca asiatica]|uniref:Uncharacterized protein n=1 Tax=Candidatus Chloroploca asiatica TaxID=1506545 RepID=A0A2H3L2S1_9CHLR|nr:hypothetical protein [Candidatus Chloroploca asiatica]PDV99053.1 hypothetical protein A9Q02_13915 [Candidatus Chloroploca asiatica]
MHNAESGRIRHSLLIRLWREETAQGEAEWRGQIQHLHSGEVHYVRGLHALTQIVQTMIAMPEQDEKAGEK